MDIELKIENIEKIYEEAMPLMQAEYDEVESGERPFGPDYASMAALDRAGLFRVLTARKDGKLVGFFTWMVDFDIESYGTLIANQCAWYVSPGNHGVAVKMFDRALEEFKALGVKFVYLHNSERGRGRTLGKFFESRGARLKSHNYVLKMEE